MIVSRKLSEGRYVSGQRFIKDLKEATLPEQFFLEETALNDLYVLLTTDIEALGVLRENEMMLLMAAKEAGQVRELMELIEPWQTG